MSPRLGCFLVREEEKDLCLLLAEAKRELITIFGLLISLASRAYNFLQHSVRPERGTDETAIIRRENTSDTMDS